MIRKIGFYILSLWLLFIFLIIIKIDIPFCFGANCRFIGIKELVTSNIVPFIALILILIGGISFYDFKFFARGATEIPFEITKIENINYENLTFLVTYIIPLVCFDLKEPRYTIVLITLLILMGFYYVRTDLFYNNPTLSLLGFNIYKVDGNFQCDENRENLVLISREHFKINQKVVYIKLAEKVYFAKES